MDEHGNPTTAVTQKGYEMEADRTEGHQDKKRRMTNLGGTKNAAAAAVKVPT